MAEDTHNNKLTFYDVHCHTMNLSHPCLYAFAKRFLDKLPGDFVAGSLIASVLAPLAVPILLNKRKTALNLLSVMERNIGRMLMAMEDDLPELEIEGQAFESIIVNPLLMDFWADEQEERLHFPFSPKTIIPQVLDVMNGIADYAHTIRGNDYQACLEPFPQVAKWARKIGAIEELRLDLRRVKPEIPGLIEQFGPSKRKLVALPFMGVNTYYCYLDVDKRLSHESTDLKFLLDKYFGTNPEFPPYTSKREDLLKNFGQFEGDIRELRRNNFAGIKVYPPLGFDPWPEDPHEQEKVRYLYRVCIERSIPITSHCSNGGYIVGTKDEAIARAHPKKWQQVLEFKEDKFKDPNFKNLKLNLAHFGGRNANRRYTETNFFTKLFHKICPDGDPEWVETIIELLTYQNVYSDMSYSGAFKGFYKTLNKIINRNPGIEEKILFGSDFSINLGTINSYKAYLEDFIQTTDIAPALKLKLCHKNPEKFLWGFIQP